MSLTKQVKFDDEVLNLLRELQWDSDGKRAVITQQLDRSTYDRVNKALTLLGGKWNRSKGGHVFEIDPRPKVEGLLDAGASIHLPDGAFKSSGTGVSTRLVTIKRNGG